MSAIGTEMLPGANMTDEQIEALIPLCSSRFYALMKLAERPSHGYAIMRDVRKRTSSRIKMGAGSTYRALFQMVEMGLAQRIGPPPEADGRRTHHYRITADGIRVLQAHVRFMEEELQRARAVAAEVAEQRSPRGGEGL